MALLILLLIASWIEYRCFAEYAPGWHHGLIAFTAAALITLSLPAGFLKRASSSTGLLAAGLCVVVLIGAIGLYPLPFLIGLFIAISIYGVGSWSFDFFSPPDITFLERAVFSLATGIVLFSYLILLCGLFGYLGRTYFLISGGFLSAFCLFRCRALWRPPQTWRAAVQTRFMEFRVWCQSPLNAGIVVILCFLLPIFVVGNLTPPIWGDDVSYHLSIARIFLRLGRISWLPDLTNYNLPFSQEMLYVAALSLGNVFTSPRIINLIFITLLFGSFLIAGRRFFSTQAGILSLFFVFSVPYYLFHTWQGGVDLKYLTYCVLAFHAYGVYLMTRERRWLILAAAMAGFSLSFRYQGFILAGILGLAILADTTDSWKQKLGSLAKFSILVLFCGFPWYARNWINTGNPLFPTSTSFFHGFYGDPELSEIWRQFGNPSSPFLFGRYGYGTSFEAFYKLPWRLTFAPGGFEGYSFTPIYLAFSPFLLIKARDGMNLKILFFSALYGFLWFFQMQQMKFLMPAFGLLGFPIAFSALGIFHRSVRPLRAAGYCLLFFPILCSIGGFYFQNYADFRQEIPVFLKREKPDDYLLKVFPSYQMTQFINAHLSPNDLIFSMVELRWYYLNRPYLLGNPLHQLVVDYRTFDSLDNFLARLKELGVTHLVCPRHPDIFMSPILGSTDAAFFLLLPELRGPAFEPIYQTDDLTLMVIHYPSKGPAYQPKALRPPYALGQFLLDHGSLMMARMQFEKAKRLGDTRADQAIQSIDAMSPLMRGDYYFEKTKEFSYPFYLKAALDEYEMAAKKSPEQSVIQDRIKTLKAYALQVIPWVWARI